jgi:hypothetical protein
MNIPNFSADVILSSSKVHYKNSKISFMRRDYVLPALNVRCYQRCINAEERRCHSIWVAAVVAGGGPLYREWQRCERTKERRCANRCSDF